MIHQEAEEEASTDYGREKNSLSPCHTAGTFYVLWFVLSVHPYKKMWAFFHRLKYIYV